MFISKINRMCERHGRIAILLIALVIIIPFVFTWAPGSGFFGSSRGGRGTVGKMFGEDVRTQDFIRHLRATELDVFMRFGQWLSDNPRYHDFLIEETLRRMRALHEARKRGLAAVSDEEVRSTLRQMFSQDGEFNAEAFMAFSRNALPRLRLSESDFQEIMRESVTINRLTSEVVDTVFISPLEAESAVRRAYEKYQVQQKSYQAADYLDKVDLTPDDAAAREYFETHREEIRMPDQKKIRAAILPLDAALAAVAVTDAEVEQYYERNRRTYDDKPLTEVREQVLRDVQVRKARIEVLEQARKLITAVKDELLAEPRTAPVDVFTAVAEKQGIKTVDSGLFRPGMPIPNLGRLPELQEHAYALSRSNPFSVPVLEGDKYYLACWQETLPGEQPAEFTPAVAAVIKDRLVHAQVVEFYQTRVEPFRVYIEQGTTLDELISRQREGGLQGAALANATRLPADEFSRYIAKYVRPYYEPRQNRVRVVTFAPAAFRDQVGEVGEEALREHYERNAAQYQEQVRASHILFRVVPEATEDEKSARRQALEELRVSIVAEDNFSEVARELSEDPGSKTKGGDLGYFSRGNMVKPFEDAAFGLAEGEISPVFETSFGYHIIKVTGKRPGQEFAEVKDQIKEMVVAEKARTLAWDAADRFSYETFEAVDQARGRKDNGPALVFAEFATERGRQFQDTPWFTAQSMNVPPFGRSWKAVNDAFALSAAQPVSNVIEGADNLYVACWLETQPASLPKLTEKPDLIPTVKEQIRQEKALEEARMTAQNEYKMILDKLGEGMKFAEITIELDFDAVPVFSLESPPPAEVPNSQVIRNTVVNYAAGTLVPPVEIQDGALLIYVADRTLPDAATVAAHRDEKQQQLLQQKQQTAVAEFYEQLKEASATDLDEGVLKQLL